MDSQFVIEDFDTKFATACNSIGHDDVAAISMKSKEWRVIRRFALLGFRQQQTERHARGKEVHPADLYDARDRPAPKLRPRFKLVRPGR
jgi:hypothetical protein